MSSLSMTPKYRDQISAVLDNQMVIFSKVLNRLGVDHIRSASNESIDICHRNDHTGRILWIYRLPESVYLPSTGKTCQNFIVELRCGTDRTHAGDAGKLARKKVGDTFVPERLLTMTVPLSIHPFHVTVYESAAGVKNLADLWTTKMRGSQRRRIIKDLIAMKRTLCFVGPSEFNLDFFEEPRAPLRAQSNETPLLMKSDLSRWSIRCAEEYQKREPAVLRDAKPMLALPNPHIHRYCWPESLVTDDGQSIILRLGEQDIVFGSNDMEDQRKSMFPDHPPTLAYLHDVFVRRTGRKYRVVAILGWESAQYCPSGYGMGEKDGMLGNHIKDTGSVWYSLLRWEGLERRKAEKAIVEPAQSTLTDTVPLMDTYGESFDKVQEKRKQCTLRRKYRWKGGRMGRNSSWMTKVKVTFRNRHYQRIHDL